MGRIKSWKELGGPGGPIHTFGLYIARQEGSGFHEHVFREGQDVKGVEVLDTRERLIERLRRLPLGIGYVRAQMVFQEKLPKELKVLELDGVDLTKDSIRNGTYPLAWPVLFYTDGYPAWGSDLHKLVTLSLSKEGQSLIEASGFVPVTEYK
jgi:ABC-type phosphate transport system substrate-binding protein